MKQFLLLITSFLMLSNICPGNEVFKQLDDRMLKTDSLVCVGLDPDFQKMPASFQLSDKSKEESIFEFLSEIVDITHEHVCCYKIQKAFFDQLDNGHSLIIQISNYIHAKCPGIPIFIDCKIGDIDNTMLAYMNLIFNQIQADGVVINPYMGDDVFEPFLSDPEKVGIVLIQTSNPNGKVVQELVLDNGSHLWEEMLDLTLTRWNKNNNLILVLSSNSDNDYSLIREKIPQETPILLAGIGSQGGNPEIMKQLLNNNRRGVFINSSRGILYPYNPLNPNWKDEVLKAVIELKSTLNNIRWEK